MEDDRRARVPARMRRLARHCHTAVRWYRLEGMLRPRSAMLMALALTLAPPFGWAAGSGLAAQESGTAAHEAAAGASAAGVPSADPLAAVFAVPAPGAQDRSAAELNALVAEARARNPEIQAARRKAEAAAARVPQAGAPADPTLAFGPMLVPTDFDVSTEMMTMYTVRLTQRIAAPGTLAARESMAREAHAAAMEEAAETELAVLTRLRSAYYEAYFIESALAVLERNRALLVDLADIAQARFAVGRVPQQDVLRAQTEVSRLDEQTSGLRARRAAALADVNAILQRPATDAVQLSYPEPVRRIAMAPPPAAIFTAAALESGLVEGLPALAELQEAAVRERPMVRAHVHRVRAARESVRLANRQRWPDVDIMLEYAHRPAFDGILTDLLSAFITVDLPIFARRKQRQRLVEAEHELAAEDLRHHQMVNELRAEVAIRYADLVRTREQILLLADGVIPQARATLESAAAAYQAGRIEFAGLLDAQGALFRHEIELARQLADFGRALAALEKTVGFELELERD